MAFLNALQGKFSSCTDISADEPDEPTSSAEYHTVSDDEEMSTATNFDTASVSLSLDLNNEDQLASISDYQTLSPDIDSDAQTVEKPRGKPQYECKVCVRRYCTLQECLRHELLEHSNVKKSPQKSVRTSLSHLLPAFEHTNQQADRKRVHELFQMCKPGDELQELFNIYCISNEKVKQIVSSVSMCLLKDLRSVQNAKVFTFGSCENGLMMWDSDIDIYVTTMYPIERYQKHRNDDMERRIYNRINANLRRGKYFDEIIAIRHARVPIIKCRHLATGMRIDINCTCPNSVVNTTFLRDLMFFDERIHCFMRFLKIWSKHMWIVGRNRMTSYCFCILALFYLQQPQGFRPALVPPIHKLQNKVQPKFVQGVNYGFGLYQNMNPLPADLTASELIRGFFKYYRNFNFFKEMIAPYLGVTVSLEDFRSGDYKYTAYLNQLNSMKAAANCSDDIENLNAERIMVVQDPFQLNQNISRAVLITQLEYFRKCIEYGYHICLDTEICTDGQLYEALLFDIIGNMENEARQLRTCTGRTTALVQPHEMLYTFSPCRAETRALMAQQLSASVVTGVRAGDNNSVYHMWARHYVEAIYVILSHVYFLNVQLLTENDDPFDERLLQHQTDEQIVSTYNTEQIVDSLRQLDQKNEVIWIINGTIDTWSGRVFQRETSQTFISFQHAQTMKLLQERMGNKAYAVNLLGRLSLKPVRNGKTLELVLKHHQQTRQWFCKKEPMRKLFTNFKCCLQNFNLKEKLQAESGRRHGIINKSEDFSWQALACSVSKAKNELNVQNLNALETLKIEHNENPAEQMKEEKNSDNNTSNA